MAEALAIASGVAGLLSLTIEVYSTSSRYISCVKNASTAILDVQRELKALKSILSELDKALEYTAAEKLFQNRPSALSSIENTEEYTEVLQKIQARLAKEASKTGLSAKLKSFTWPFNEERTQGILDVLRRHVNAFGQALSIDSFRVEAEILKEVQLLGKQKRDKKLAYMLECLSPATHDVKQKQHDIFARRVGNTGTWLLDHPDFKRWSEDPSPPILWCSGDPGSGKTVLSSIVIDHLSRESNPDEVVHAAIYCDYKDQANQTTLGLIGSITKQVIQGRSSPFQPLEDLHESLNHRSALPTLNDYEALLHTASRTYQKVFLVIDALDELLPDRRKTLLPILRRLQEQKLVRILVTSRPHAQDIQRAFREQTKLEIRASDQDVQLFVRTQVEDDEDLLDAMDDDEKMKEEVVETIVTAARGIILLPVLQLKHLQGLFSKSQIRNALRTMPKDPFGMYDTTIERIKRQGDQRSELALAVLGWISYARRPLLIDELRHALAVEFCDDKDYKRVNHVDVENLIRPQLLIDVCAGLVNVETDSKVVRLVHFTTQEYFNKNGGKHFPGIPARIAGTNLTYLLFDEFQSGPCPDKESLQERLRQYPFYDYAASHWGDHTRGTLEVNSLDMILELIRNDKKLCASVQACNSREPEFFRWCNMFGHSPCGFGPLHCAASQGLDRAIKVLLAEGKDPCEMDGTFKTPLHWAAWRGHCSSLGLLLDTGIDIHMPSRDGFLLLETAADQDREEVVRLLLDRGFDINKRGFGGHTALLTAALMGRDSLVNLLLERGADHELKSQFGETALLKAVLSGHEGIVETLLDHGADFQSSNACGNTALHCAAYTDRFDILKLLLARGADVNTATTDGATALHLAANRGHEDIIKYLVANGANLEAKSNDESEDLIPLVKEVGRCIPRMVRLDSCARGATPLFEAALHARESAFRYLLSLGASPDTRDVESSTLLMAAIDAIGHCKVNKDGPMLTALTESATSVAKSLIGNGANVNDSDINQDTPLLVCAHAGPLWLFELLVEHGAELEARNKDGDAMLHLAAANGHTDIVDWLLKRGVELELENTEGCTALHLAVQTGGLETTRVLLDKGANIEALDTIGRTPLIRSVLTHSAELVQFLLDRGANADYQVFDGVDALYVAILHDQLEIMKVLIGENDDLTKVLEEREIIHLAAERGDIDVLRVLVKHGVPLTSEDSKGETAIHYAASGGDTEMIQYLIEAGSEVDIPGKLQQRPLLYAAAQGYEEAVVALCDKGADVNQKASNGWSALDWALHDGYISIARVLVERGARIECGDETQLWDALKDRNFPKLQFLIEHLDKTSPVSDEIRALLLPLAAECRAEGFSRFLIERGFPVNATTRNGNTALTNAVHEGSLEIVELLLRNGANTTMSFYDINPLYLALDLGHEEIAHRLAENDVEFQANEAMFIAVRKGLFSFANRLIIQGADTPFTKLEDTDQFGNTLLHVAAAHGHVDCTQLLLDNGAAIEAVNLQSETPLFESTMGTARLLLDKGADVNAVDERGRTTLHRVSNRAYGDENDNLELAELLLSRGAGVNHADIGGDTPLHFSCTGPFAERTTLLLARGANISARNSDNDQALHVAVRYQRDRWQGNSDARALPEDATEERIDLLLKWGADINARGFHQTTALHVAVEHAMTAEVEYLLQRGADIEAEDDEKWTPILYACVRDSPTSIFDTLLRLGADMQKTDRSGRNALALALEHESYSAAEFLLKHSFSAATGPLNLSTTSLHRAAGHGYTTLLSFLLQQEQVDLEFKSKVGLTPLGRAVVEEQGESVRILLKHGADPSALARCGCSRGHSDSLLITAAKNSDAQILMCLVEHGIDPNIRNHHNNTPLILASEGGRIDCVKALLGLPQIDVNAIDNDGDTALICAANKGQFEVSRLLLERNDVDLGIINLEGRTAKETAVHRGYRDLMRLFEAHEQGLDLQHVEADPSDDSEVDEVDEVDEVERPGSPGPPIPERWVG